MKIKLTFLFVILLNTIVIAQAPQKISYQAVIRNNSGNLVTNQVIGLRIAIWQSTMGASFYTETQTPMTNSFGMISIEIGSGTLVTGDFSTINWANGPFLLKTEIDIAGGTNYTITGSSQLLSVPYALYARNGFSHYIGEYFGGGIIFHLFKDYEGNEHGLIVSLNDLSLGEVWINNPQLAYAVSTWNGKVNTNNIVNADGATNAATLCDNYEYDNYNDWYLPSLDELLLLPKVRFDINKMLDQYAGNQLYNLDYWSSTLTGSQAYSVNLLMGSVMYSHVSNRFAVRPIRSF